jgi:phosphoribosylamine--glycine ligase
VLEFNVRFGDPECQAILPRLKTDLVDLMQAAVDGTLDQVSVEWDSRAAVCVVLAAQGYPGAYEKGKEIHGLEKLRDWPDGIVFHAGTAARDGHVVTNGGRVLGVTALGADIPAAVAEAYRAVDKITWDGMRFRRDIGQRALERSS